MKKPLLLTLLYFTATYTFAQDVKSDLYLKVVEVMKTDLNYTYDSTSNQRPEPKPDTIAIKKRKPGIHDSLPIILNPSPLIIVDGRGYDMDGLNNLKLSDVETIKAEKGTNTTALYGSHAKPGVVFITTNKGSKR